MVTLVQKICNVFETLEMTAAMNPWPKDCVRFARRPDDKPAERPHRVNRLGEFSPLALLINFDGNLKITEVARILGYLYTWKKLRTNFEETWFELHFGRFCHKHSSGHPDDNQSSSRQKRTKSRIWNVFELSKQMVCLQEQLNRVARCRAMSCDQIRSNSISVSPVAWCRATRFCYYV
jgi:hypothetical protein